jgi:hypothetical protein
MTPILLTLAAFAGAPEYWAVRAEQFAAQEEWTAAIENSDEAVRMDHDNPRRYLDRAYIKLKARRFAEALGDANRAELRYRRFGTLTMAPPYLIGEVHRLSAMDAAALNQANVALVNAEFELQRIERDIQTPAPPAGATEEEQDRVRQERLTLLTDLLQQTDAQREESYSVWETVSASNDSLKQAKESYSIAIGRLPQSPHPYKGRQLTEKAMPANQEVLHKAEQVLEKANSLYKDITSGLRALSDVSSPAAEQGGDGDASRTNVRAGRAARTNRG